MAENFFDQLFYVAAALCLIYLIFIRGHYLAIAFSSLLQKGVEEMRERNQDLELILHSRHTIPISAVLTSPEGSQQSLDKLFASLDSLLKQHYPEFEIILVIDQPLPEELRERYDLKPKTQFFSKVIPTKEFRDLYRSRKFENLIVIEKDASESWDAVNVGLNAARYRYILPIQVGITLHQEALLKLIRPALYNPKEIVAVSAALDMHRDDPATAKKRSLGHYILRSLTTLDHLRNLLISQIDGKPARALLSAKLGFWGENNIALWRKDTILNLGGLNRGGVFDLSLRIHHHFQRTKERYQIVTIADMVGTMACSKNLGSFVRQLDRSSKQQSYTINRHRQMFFNWRYRSTGMLLLPYAFLQTYVTPWVELAAFTLLPLGALYGALSWQPFLLILTLMLGTSLFANLLVLLFTEEQNAKPRSLRELLGLVATSILEYAGFRQLCAATRLGFVKTN